MNPETAAKPNPIEQFELQRLWTHDINGVDVSFTNASLYMLFAALGVVLIMVIATSSKALVPGRGQSAAEMLYEFVANTVRQTAGSEGMKFFPFVFTLFAFVLISNLIGLVPYTFSVTSQIVVTFSFAILVMLIVVAYGFYRNGFGFLKLFVPHGVPAPVLAVLIRSRSSPSFRVRFRSLFVSSLIFSRSHHARGVWRLRCAVAGRGRLEISCSRSTARHHGALRSRIAGRLLAGVRLFGTHLRLSERRNSPGH